MWQMVRMFGEKDRARYSKSKRCGRWLGCLESVVLNGKKSRWRRQRNGLPQGSVLAPRCCSTVYQRPAHTPRHSQLHLRRQLVHRVARKRLQQHRSVTHVCPEHYDHLYYDTNQLRANPSKTQMCAFHLRNREAKRELNVVWNGTRLSNTTTPVYLGIHLDRTLCYKMHIEKTNNYEGEREK